MCDAKVYSEPKTGKQEQIAEGDKHQFVVHGHLPEI